MAICSRCTRTLRNRGPKRPKRPSGRPKKYATEEERQAAIEASRREASKRYQQTEAYKESKRRRYQERKDFLKKKYESNREAVSQKYNDRAYLKKLAYLKVLIRDKERFTETSNDTLCKEVMYLTRNYFRSSILGTDEYLDLQLIHLQDISAKPVTKQAIRSAINGTYKMTKEALTEQGRKCDL